MGWKTLDFKERWVLMATGFQALAAVGTFLVALIGIWSVTPIITYQTYQIEQKQEAEKEAARMKTKLFPTGQVEEVFVDDVLTWWQSQVQAYERILELIANQTKRGLKITFEVVEAGAPSTVPGVTPDLLIVRSTDPNGKTEILKVPVNANAMTPSQYLQCKINQGAFSALDSAQRDRVEMAVGRYLHKYMLPKVPPAYVRQDMSLKELYNEISLHQDHRRESTRQIRALRGIVEAALEES